MAHLFILKYAAPFTMENTTAVNMDLSCTEMHWSEHTLLHILFTMGLNTSSRNLLEEA